MNDTNDGMRPWWGYWTRSDKRKMLGCAVAVTIFILLTPSRQMFIEGITVLVSGALLTVVLFYIISLLMAILWPGW